MNQLLMTYCCSFISNTDYTCDTTYTKGEMCATTIPENNVSLVKGRSYQTKKWWGQGASGKSGLFYVESTDPTVLARGAFPDVSAWDEFHRSASSPFLSEFISKNHPHNQFMDPLTPESPKKIIVAPVFIRQQTGWTTQIQYPLPPPPLRLLLTTILLMIFSSFSLTTIMTKMMKQKTSNCYSPFYMVGQGVLHVRNEESVEPAHPALQEFVLRSWMIGVGTTCKNTTSWQGTTHIFKDVPTWLWFVC